MINIYKLYAIITLLWLYFYENVAARFGKDDIIPRWESIVPSGSLPSGTGFLDGLAEYAKDTIFGVLVLVVIGMFLYIGTKLIIARGQPEEFGNAMKSLVFVVVGIFVVSVAWLWVQLISSLEINY